MLDAENPPGQISPAMRRFRSRTSWHIIFMPYGNRKCGRRWNVRGKYIDHYMGGLLTAENVDDAEAVIIASGSAAAQSREAVRLCKEKGIKVGLIKVRSLRPFPTEELRKLCGKAKLIVVPEFNYVGWLAKEGGDCHLWILQCKDHRGAACIWWSVHAGRIDCG